MSKSSTGSTIRAPFNVTFFTPLFGEPHITRAFAATAGYCHSSHPLFGGFILTPMAQRLAASPDCPNAKLLELFSPSSRAARADDPDRIMHWETMNDGTSFMRAKMIQFDTNEFDVVRLNPLTTTPSTRSSPPSLSRAPSTASALSVTSHGTKAPSQMNEHLYPRPLSVPFLHLACFQPTPQTHLDRATGALLYTKWSKQNDPRLAAARKASVFPLIGLRPHEKPNKPIFDHSAPFPDIDPASITPTDPNNEKSPPLPLPLMTEREVYAPWVLPGPTFINVTPIPEYNFSSLLHLPHTTKIPAYHLCTILILDFNSPNCTLTFTNFISQTVHLLQRGSTLSLTQVPICVLIFNDTSPVSKLGLSTDYIVSVLGLLGFAHHKIMLSYHHFSPHFRYINAKVSCGGRTIYHQHSHELFVQPQPTLRESDPYTPLMTRSKLRTLLNPIWDLVYKNHFSLYFSGHYTYETITTIEQLALNSNLPPPHPLNLMIKLVPPEVYPINYYITRLTEPIANNKSWLQCRIELLRADLMAMKGHVEKKSSTVAAATRNTSQHDSLHSDNFSFDLDFHNVIVPVMVAHMHRWYTFTLQSLRKKKADIRATIKRSTKPTSTSRPTLHEINNQSSHVISTSNTVAKNDCNAKIALNRANSMDRCSPVSPSTTLLAIQTHGSLSPRPKAGSPPNHILESPSRMAQYPGELQVNVEATHAFPSRPQSPHNVHPLPANMMGFGPTLTGNHHNNNVHYQPLAVTPFQYPLSIHSLISSPSQAHNSPPGSPTHHRGNVGQDCTSVGRVGSQEYYQGAMNPFRAQYNNNNTNPDGSIKSSNVADQNSVTNNSSSGTIATSTMTKPPLSNHSIAGIAIPFEAPPPTPKQSRLSRFFGGKTETHGYTPDNIHSAGFFAAEPRWSSDPLAYYPNPVRHIANPTPIRFTSIHNPKLVNGGRELPVEYRNIYNPYDQTGTENISTNSMDVELRRLLEEDGFQNGGGGIDDLRLIYDDGDQIDTARAHQSDPNNGIHFEQLSRQEVYERSDVNNNQSINDRFAMVPFPQQFSNKQHHQSGAAHQPYMPQVLPLGQLPEKYEMESFILWDEFPLISDPYNIFGLPLFPPLETTHVRSNSLRDFFVSFTPLRFPAPRSNFGPFSEEIEKVKKSILAQSNRDGFESFMMNNSLINGPGFGAPESDDHPTQNPTPLPTSLITQLHPVSIPLTHYQSRASWVHTGPVAATDMLYYVSHGSPDRNQQPDPHHIHHLNNNNNHIVSSNFYSAETNSRGSGPFDFPMTAATTSAATASSSTVLNRTTTGRQGTTPPVGRTNHDVLTTTGRGGGGGGGGSLLTPRPMAHSSSVNSLRDQAPSAMNRSRAIHAAIGNGYNSGRNTDYNNSNSSFSNPTNEDSLEAFRPTNSQRMLIINNTSGNNNDESLHISFSQQSEMDPTSDPRDFRERSRDPEWYSSNTSHHDDVYEARIAPNSEGTSLHPLDSHAAQTALQFDHRNPHNAFFIPSLLSNRSSSSHADDVIIANHVPQVRNGNDASQHPHNREQEEEEQEQPRVSFNQSQDRVYTANNNNNNSQYQRNQNRKFPILTTRLPPHSIYHITKPRISVSTLTPQINMTYYYSQCDFRQAGYSANTKLTTSSRHPQLFPHPLGHSGGFIPNLFTYGVYIIPFVYIKGISESILAKYQCESPSAFLYNNNPGQSDDPKGKVKANPAGKMINADILFNTLPNTSVTPSIHAPASSRPSSPVLQSLVNYPPQGNHTGDGPMLTPSTSCFVEPYTLPHSNGDCISLPQTNNYEPAPTVLTGSTTQTAGTHANTSPHFNNGRFTYPKSFIPPPLPSLGQNQHCQSYATQNIATTGFSKTGPQCEKLSNVLPDVAFGAPFRPISGINSITQLNCPITFIILCINPVTPDYDDETLSNCHSYRPSQAASTTIAGSERQHIRYESPNHPSIQSQTSHVGAAWDSSLNTNSGDQSNQSTPLPEYRQLSSPQPSSPNASNRPQSGSIWSSLDTPSAQILIPSNNGPQQQQYNSNNNNNNYGNLPQSAHHPNTPKFTPDFTTDTHTINSTTTKATRNTYNSLNTFNTNTTNNNYQIEHITQLQFNYFKQYLPQLYKYQLTRQLFFPLDGASTEKLDHLWNVEFIHSSELVSTFQAIETNAVQTRLNLYSAIAERDLIAGAGKP